MRKTLLALMFSLSVFGSHASIVKKVTDPIISYMWILHTNGCYYLYRIETIEGNGFAVDWMYPMNYSNYDGTYVRCVYAETIETMC